MSDRGGDEGSRGNGESRTSVQRLWQRLRSLVGLRGGDTGLREALEEIIEEHEDEEEAAPIGQHERLLLSNILQLRHLTAYDVMVPRADIVAVETSTSLDELLALVAKGGHSRLPVYRNTLDEVLGLVHIKDVLTRRDTPASFKLSTITREILFVAPSMPVLDLLLEMRIRRVHMALVVDEYGGVDGLVTIEDLVEEIVGEIEDEHDSEEEVHLTKRPDGSIIADARATIEDFERLVGPMLTAEEREEDIDTLGGLVFSVAGRVPARGELIVHLESGISFEVLDADPRRVRRLRIRNLPPRSETQGSDA